MALDLIRAQQCHVVGFQEVLANQRADLEAGLEGYLWLGSGRDADAGGEQCCLAIDPSFEVLDSGTFWLCPTPDVPGSVGWDAQLTRICTWASLAKDGARFRVLNSHWDHQGVLARTESARMLCEHIEALDEPVLLMGDFNTAPDSKPIALLTGRLLDTYAHIHPNSLAGTFHGFGRTEGARIDYLLTSSEFLVIDSYIVRPNQPAETDPTFTLQATSSPSVDVALYPSDHHAVYGSYELIE
jgi:endonuclease/exonuclease/phosphatase family metal-dependent hydrolase